MSKDTPSENWGEWNRTLMIEQLSPYLEKISRRGSEGTAQVYSSAFVNLCEFVEKLPNQILSELKGSEQDVYDFLDSFVAYLHNTRKASPTTTNVYLAGIKRILRLADIEISNEKFRDKVALPPVYKETNDRIPTQEEFQRMLNMADICGRATLTMLASSGMRIGELLSLQIRDIDFAKHPTQARIRAMNTKTKTSRLVFVSDEATTFLRDYLGSRIDMPESYVFCGANASNPASRVKDPSRPMTYENACSIFYTILQKAGLTQKDGKRYVIHPHCLRKFFFSRMLPVIGRDITEALMGHEGYLDSSYQRWTADEMAKHYLRGMKAVTILLPLAEVSREDVETLTTLKALEMTVPNSKKMLSKLELDAGRGLSIQERIDVLQKEREKIVEEEKNRRFAEKVVHQLQLLWYEQGVDGMSESEIKEMARKFGIADHETALRETGVCYYPQDNRWRFLLLERRQESDLDGRKKYQSQFVKKASKKEIQELVEQGFEIKYEMADELLLTRTLS